MNMFEMSAPWASCVSQHCRDPVLARHAGAGLPGAVPGWRCDAATRPASLTPDRAPIQAPAWTERPSLADFDWRFNPKLPRSACFELHTLKFIGEGANALIIGKPGTGKSHVAKAVAYQATLQGYDVRYVEADTEFARYALANAAERTELLKDWVAPDLLVLDDLFLARRISEHAAEVLQAIVHQRYKLPAHRRDVQPGVQDWRNGRRHHGQHHPGVAALRDAGVRGQELPAKEARRAHRHSPESS